MFDRLSIDPGHRTLGELIQERQWAVEETSRVHKEVTRLNARRDGASKRPNVNQDTLPAGPDDIRRSPPAATRGRQKAGWLLSINDLQTHERRAVSGSH